MLKKRSGLKNVIDNKIIEQIKEFHYLGCSTLYVNNRYVYNN